MQIRPTHTLPSAFKHMLKIAYLGAGAAGRICGACLHDNGLAAALQKLGEDLILIPTYTPLRTDEANVSHARVFFGGLNVFLQQKSAVFRHTPWFLDRLLDAPALLNWLSRRSSGIEARDLGELTVSTLQGEHGKQRKEIAKLLAWLTREFRPDVVHLSNVLLAGMAEPLKQKLGVPLICSLMGEDIFLEGLTEPHYTRARELLRQSARHIDRFVSLNNYYADRMSEYLQVPRDKIEIIRHGLNLQGHEPRGDSDSNVADKMRGGEMHEVTLGFFARIAVEKGLHNLVEAFALLTKRSGLPPLRLRAAGYISDADRPYYERIAARIAELGLQDRFDSVGEVDRPGKMAFLKTIDIMAVPTVYHESKGISVLEALASGVPVVLPRHGTFPEYIAETGGGVLCEPENPAALADALAELIVDPARARGLGRQGAASIREKFTAEAMAREHQRLYRRVTGKD